MDLMKVKYQYFPYEAPRMWSGSAAGFMFDEPKHNLLWLVHPDIDALHRTAWGGDMYTESIDTHMDSATRRALQDRPTTFHEYWLRSVQYYTPRIAVGWAPDYLRVMEGRVRRAEQHIDRMLSGHDNVVQWDFKRKVRIA